MTLFKGRDYVFSMIRNDSDIRLLKICSEEHKMPQIINILYCDIMLRNRPLRPEGLTASLNNIFGPKEC